MTIELPLAIFHEITARGQIPRTPEIELVMNGEQTVEDYSGCGDDGGALFGPYLYNAVQVSARLRPSDHVVDLGCGSGRLLNLIASWNPQVQFTGVDLAPVMLQTARDQANAMGLFNVTYLEDDFSKLDVIQDQSADAVISSMALHHLPDRAALSRCFATIGRVLRPDGALYLMDFGRLRSKRAVDIFVAKVARTETPSLSADYRASLYAAFTPEDFVHDIVVLDHSKVSLFCTAVAPLIMIVCTPRPGAQLDSRILNAYRDATRRLSAHRRGELSQMRMFLRLGGLEFPG
jgi:arsenite methyltransferase